MTLLQWLTFLIGSLTVTYNPGLLDFFLYSGAIICLTVSFPPLEKFDHVVVSVTIDFPSKSK